MRQNSVVPLELEVNTLCGQQASSYGKFGELRCKKEAKDLRTHGHRRKYSTTLVQVVSLWSKMCEALEQPQAALYQRESAKIRRSSGLGGLRAGSVLLSGLISFFSVPLCCSTQSHAYRRREGKHLHLLTQQPPLQSIQLRQQEIPSGSLQNSSKNRENPSLDFGHFQQCNNK